MAEEKEVTDLEHDIPFQQKSWRVQRVGWASMLAIAIAALLGLFGDGPLASADVDSGSGLKIRYQRFTRMHAQQTVDIVVGEQAIVSDSLRLWIDRDWLAANRVLEIMPEPARSEVLADRIVYTFSASRMTGPVEVHLELEVQRPGS